MNIRNRLLYKSNGLCRICFSEESHNHFEVCEENYKNKCITLHNNVIDVIATQLIKRGQIVTTNPRTEIIKSFKKADILITGDLAFNKVKSAIDVTFASLANKSHVKKINKLNNDDFESENQFGINAGIEVLKDCEKLKRKEYVKHFTTSFVPLAFLSNGSTSTKNLRWLQSISLGNKVLYQLSSAICKGKIEMVY
jgi:ribosomal protein L17